MELLYDVEQSDGKVISGVYFVKQVLPLRGGKNNHALIYSDAGICAYDRNDKKVFVDLLNANIIRVYDVETETDFMDEMIKKHEEAEERFGSRLPFPFARRSEMVELISK